MTLKASRLKAIFIKDVRSSLRNSSTMLLSLLPLVFTILYGSMNIGGEKMPVDMVLSTGLLMNVCMFPLSAMSMSIAEEKEKNTLRTLMLASVTAGEFLICKSLFIFIITEAINIIIFVIATMAMPTALFLLVSSLCVFSLMTLGALVGIIAKNQMSTSLLYMPIMLIMLVPAILARISDGIAAYARFTPTYAMIDLLLSKAGMFSFGVLAVWIIFGMLLFSLVYMKKRLD